MMMTYVLGMLAAAIVDGCTILGASIVMYGMYVIVEDTVKAIARACGRKGETE